MKKYIVIPFGICLFVIALSGFFIYSGYTAGIDAKKELLVSYVSNARTQMGNIVMSGGNLSYIVKPIVGDKGILANDLSKLYAANISELENYYDANNYFIKGISIFDRYGNAFNIYRDNNEGTFIKDSYKSRIINVLQSEEGIVVDKNTISYILPVFRGDTLAGNVALNINVDSVNTKVFRPYLDKGDIWPGMILGHDDYLIYPLEDELALSQEKKITEEIEKGQSGFSTGKMNSNKVLTYYERLPVAGYLFGLIFSYNISPDISSALTKFAIVCLILLALTGIAVYFLRRTVLRFQEETGKREQLLDFMSAAYRKAPAGILVTRQNILFSGNDCAFRLLKGFVTRSDIGKDISAVTFPPGYSGGADQDEFQEWTLCTFERGGREICLGKKQMVVEEPTYKYTIDVFWDISDMERNRRDAIRSEIAKSELLSRISTDFKKPLDSIENAAVLLMEKYPKEPNIAHINESTANLSDLIDNVQDFADIEAGRIVPDEIPFNVVNELRNITDMYNGEAKQKGINLKVHISSTAIREVVGDPQRFGQVVDQLLSNAVKFTDEGEIRVSMETTELQDGKVMIKCSIEDTGRGMSKQKLKNLFSIDIRAKEEGESIGLGIIVAKKLTGIMGGTIRVTSPSPISTRPEAPGVQFSFTIQCHSDRQPGKKLDYSSVRSYDRINVLIISSDPHQVQYLSNHLSRKDISTDIFVYNKESSELLINKLIIDKDRYQIVVIEAADIDISFAVAEKIYLQDLTEQCMYVFIDPYHRKGNYLKARSLRMDYYFVKSDDLSGFDAVLKDRFPGLSEKKKPDHEVLRKDIRIMIAENNTLSQTVAHVVFKNLGYEVDFTGNALELISEMNKKNYDIIFLDLKFPPSDGFQIAEVLRGKDYKLPIIAMTSTQTKENLKNISDSGMNGYVPKPLNPESIKNVLLKWFV